MKANSGRRRAQSVQSVNQRIEGSYTGAIETSLRRMVPRGDRMVNGRLAEGEVTKVSIDFF